MMDYEYIGEIVEIADSVVKLDSGKHVPKKDLTEEDLSVGRDLHVSVKGLQLVYLIVPKCGFCETRLLRGDEQFICPSCNKYHVSVEEPRLGAGTDVPYSPEENIERLMKQISGQ